MRTIVISDIHGNIDVVRALEHRWGRHLEQFDRVVCLGDLVDYGPDARDVIDWVRACATDVVRGNHDHAMATGDPCGSSSRYLQASRLTRERLRETLDSGHLAYLAGLPTRVELRLDGEDWLVVHATPRNPLTEYRYPEDPDDSWRAAIEGDGQRRMLLGHTHLPFVRPIDGSLAVNPGSLGMPKDGDAHGSYVVIDGGAIRFFRVRYDPEPMLRRLRALGLPDPIVRQLTVTFLTGA
jgi:predicted phosphodiesterase